jgi:polar amino acid transport system substrate-binding protein
MRNALRSVVILPVALLIAACSSGGAATASPSAAAPSASAAQPSAAESESAAASQSACSADQLQTKTAGTFTIGTDNPAYPPFFQVPTGSPTAPWELGDPTNGEGFESAFAFALAEQLGFANDAVVWAHVPFDNAIAPGAKTFDIVVNQVSFTPERAQAVDLSDGYYFVNQSVVALKDTPIAGTTSIAALKPFKFGAQSATTSLDTINNVIAPTAAAMVYNSNDDAIAALKAKQIDGLVVDLPTAFYVTAVQVPNSKILGQFPAPAGGEHFGMVFQKGSRFVGCVNRALAKMRGSGQLKSLQQTWLAKATGAPVLH